MNIAQLQRAQLRGIGDEASRLPTPRQREKAGSPSFSDTLENAIDEVDEAQKESNRQIEAFIAGEQKDLHEVMIAMEEANLSFQLLVEVRNRVLDAYKQLMRLQV